LSTNHATGCGKYDCGHSKEERSREGRYLTDKIQLRNPSVEGMFWDKNLRDSKEFILTLVPSARLT
jgi:hypothetical protein